MVSRVFVVEMPLRFDRGLGRMVPARDLTDACRFGEIVHLLPPSGEGRPFDPAPQIAELWDKLIDITEDDHIVAGMGHPLLLAAAVSIASCLTNGKLRMLHWLREDAGYQSVRMDVFAYRQSQKESA